MPLHNWGEASDSDFHSFLHHGWIWNLMRYLNKTVLPKRYIAMAERHVGSYIADLATLELEEDETEKEISYREHELPPTLVVAAPVFTSIGKQITIYDQGNSKVVAVLELISPGNKNSWERAEVFVEKSVDHLQAGIHYVIVDILPPQKWADNFVKKILMAIRGKDFVPQRNLYAGSFRCIMPKIQVYVKEFDVGDVLPQIPVFLSNDDYVFVDLEKTYEDTIQDIPDSKIPSIL